MFLWWDLCHEFWHMDFHILSNIPWGMVPLWEPTAGSAFSLRSHLTPPVSPSQTPLCETAFFFLASQLPHPDFYLSLHLSPWSPYSLHPMELASQFSVYSVFYMPPPVYYWTLNCTGQCMLKHKDILGKRVFSYFLQVSFLTCPNNLPHEAGDHEKIQSSMQSSHGLDDPCLIYLNFLKSCISK